jgi:hypothetical protein
MFFRSKSRWASIVLIVILGTLSLTRAHGAVVVTSIAPVGADTGYIYSFAGLSGNGDVFIPIIDPSGLVALPNDAALITDRAFILAEWPGPGNIIPGGKANAIFNDPAALLVVPEDGSNTLSFSFLASGLPVRGPILADSTLLDPPLPGPSSIPEPATLLLLGAGLSATLLRVRARRSSLPLV